MGIGQQPMSDLKFTLVNLRPAFIIMGILFVAYKFDFNGMRTNPEMK